MCLLYTPKKMSSTQTFVAVLSYSQTSEMLFVPIDVSQILSRINLMKSKVFHVQMFWVCAFLSSIILYIFFIF